MARPKKGETVIPTVFKNAPVYEDTKQALDAFCKQYDIGIAKAMKRIVPLGIRHYWDTKHPKKSK